VSSLGRCGFAKLREGNIPEIRALQDGTVLTHSRAIFAWIDQQK
jgi:hypothetical protein